MTHHRWDGPARRFALVAGAAAVVTALASCIGTGPSPAVRPDIASSVAASLIVPGSGDGAGRAGDRSHPGAAVLAGDVVDVPAAPMIPAATEPISPLAIKNCQVFQTVATPMPCTLLKPTPIRRTIAVVGDSVARQWLPALLLIASRRHWQVVIEIHSRCPFSATMTVNAGQITPYTACHDWGAAVQKQLLTSIRPDVVITSDLPVLGVPGHPAPSPRTLSAIGDGMATYWRELIAHGIAVAPIRESPEMHIIVPTCLLNSGGDTSRCTVSWEDAIRAAPPTVVAAGQVPAAHLIDMNPLICGRPRCQPVVGNVLVYKDSHHLTNEYMVTLAPYLERALRQVPALSG